MVGLALVVAVNSLGSSFLKTISDEFDRSFARDLTVQPHGFAPGEGPQQTIANGLRDRLARIPEAKVVARERFLYTADLPGPPSKKGSDGLLLGFDPAQYEQVDETDIEGAPARPGVRAHGARLGDHRQGLGGRDRARGGRPDHASGPVRDAADTRGGDRRDRGLRRPDGEHVPAHDARASTGSPPTPSSR